MEYNVDVTNDHPLAGKFAFNFNNMVKADGGKGIFPENAIAILLDDAERVQGRAVLLKTMDSALGVITRGTSGSTKDRTSIHQNTQGVEAGDHPLVDLSHFPRHTGQLQQYVFQRGIRRSTI